jgi:biofilm PGA synthesis N-glycosyltransferase PgaC
MNLSTTRYVIITPARDEELHIRTTIESMLGQTILPVEWVIVNDGSTDGTGKIVDEYAARYPWIRAVHRTNRGFRKAGGGVVDTFNDGYRTLTCKDWDFIVKLDGDLSFEPDYFEKCFGTFDLEPQLGVGGGVMCYIENGTKSFEANPAFHVRGATKIYKRACWDAIGGFWPAPGWDTMDEVKASMLGWTTRSFPDLHLLHHRHTGAADGAWANWVKNGRANYICGYHPLFMLSKCVHRLGQRPYIVGSAALLYGFLTGYLNRIPQVDEPKTIQYLRQQQIARLLGRKTIWE